MSFGASPRSSAVRVVLPDLLALARPAAAVNLDAMKIRAPQHGGMLSPLRGRGMEFDESRRYQDGDDVRSIDWRTTARTGHPHTKLFREERERPVLIGVDLRRSMFFATHGAFKAVRAAQAAALLGWAASQRGDRVGGLVMADGLHRELSPARGRRGVLRLLEALLTLPDWDKRRSPANDEDTLDVLVARLQRVARPGARVLLLSDYRDLQADTVLALRRLARHADLLTVLIHDRLERELPPPGRYPLLLAGRRSWLDSSDGELRRRHRERFLRREERLVELASVPGVHHLRCATDSDVVAELQRRFAKQRGGAR